MTTPFPHCRAGGPQFECGTWSTYKWDVPHLKKSCNSFIQLQLIHTAATHSHKCNSFAQLQLTCTAATHSHSKYGTWRIHMWVVPHPTNLLPIHAGATHSHRCNSFTQLQLIHTTATQSNSTCRTWHVHIVSRISFKKICYPFIQLQLIRTAATHLHSCNSFTQLQLAFYSLITRTNKSCHTYG